MNSNTLNLEPVSVFRYFQEISKIPRCSGNEKAISDYLVDFAKRHNLEVVQDDVLNVIIKKPASPGYENAPGVILQGHMDMVCEKNKDTAHNFLRDPLQLRVEGDMLYAESTTLGADNGIAVAFAMALLAAEDIPHPPLEVLVTVEEETGMKGATSLDPRHLTGKYLINLDSEEEGKLLVSCSGGIRVSHSLPITYVRQGGGWTSYLLSLRGLKGGHSGMDIHKGRGNANKLMGRVLADLSSTIDLYIQEINGGSKTNAIPREADVLLRIPSSMHHHLMEKVEKWSAILKNELRVSDSEVTLEVKNMEDDDSPVFSREASQKVIASLMLIPNGIQTMSMSIPGLVESSTNLGVVTTQPDRVTFESAVRSSVESLKQAIVFQSQMAAKVIGAEFSSGANYPGWEYDPDSKLRDIFKRVYTQKYGKDSEIIAIHAGVECGLLKEKKPDLDMISLGPNMYDVHTPNEHLSISSTQRTWEYLLAVLQEIRS